MAVAGIIARNDQGQVVAGLTRFFPATSPLMTEALSFREALAFAENMGMTKIVVENDCLELIQACRKEVVRGEIFNVVKDVLFLKENFQYAAFTWISRDGNGVAHQVDQVAMLSSRNLLPVNWIWNPPLSLVSLLLSDKAQGRHGCFPYDPGG